MKLPDISDFKIPAIIFIIFLLIGVLLPIPLVQAQAVSITYNSTLNRITCTGGTELAPITLWDIWNASDVLGWGVVLKTGTDAYFISSHLHIGDGSTTYLKMENGESLQLGTAAARRAICLLSNAHFQMGNKDTDGYGIKGANLLWYSYYTNAEQGQGGYNLWRGEFKCYDSNFIMSHGGFVYLALAGVVDIVDTSHIVLNLGTVYFTSASSGNLTRTLFYCKLVYIYSPNLAIDAIKLPKDLIGTLSGGNSVITGVDYGTTKQHTVYYNRVTTFIDSEILNSKILSSGHFGNKAYKKFHFDLKVTNKDGDGIDEASVKIWDSQGTLVVDVTTGTGNKGCISQQLLTTYYKRYVDNLWEGLDYSPFTLQIIKAGHQTYTSSFTLLEKTDWTVTIQNPEIVTETETEIVLVGRTGRGGTTLIVVAILLVAVVMVIGVKKR